MEKSVKCLLVDDLEETCWRCRRFLQRQDVQILTARSGSQALGTGCSSTHVAACASLDVQIRRWMASELAELMREREDPPDPIIFVPPVRATQPSRLQGI